MQITHHNDGYQERAVEAVESLQQLVASRGEYSMGSWVAKVSGPLDQLVMLVNDLRDELSTAAMINDSKDADMARDVACSVRDNGLIADALHDYAARYNAGDEITAMIRQLNTRLYRPLALPTVTVRAQINVTLMHDDVRSLADHMRSDVDSSINDVNVVDDCIIVEVDVEIPDQKLDDDPNAIAESWADSLVVDGFDVVDWEVREAYEVD